jgi:hypothetical protein
MPRMPLVPVEGERREHGRCDPTPAPLRPDGAAAPRPFRPELIDLIPPEWVGLTGPAAFPGQSAPSARDGTPTAKASVIASPPDASLLSVTPAPGWLERGACVVEPGKPCRSSGRCRQLGH